jgi:hypothetical protein
MTDAQLKQIYTSYNYPSATKLYKVAKDRGINVTAADVKAFLEKQYPYQLTKSIVKPKKYNTIWALKAGDDFQLDVIIYDRWTYNQYAYILCVIDVHSRFAQARAMTSHSIPNIIKNLQDIFQVMTIPKEINCDNEFNKPEFKRFAAQNNIKMNYSYVDEINKNAIVERWNRTLAGMLNKVRVATQKYDWNRYLPDVVDTYNNTYHRTIKATPADVWNGTATNKQKRVFLPMNYSVNNRVRIILPLALLGKADRKTHTEEIYTIESIHGNRYKLENVQKPLYKEYELTRVDSDVKTPDIKPSTYRKHEVKHTEIQKDRKQKKVRKELRIYNKNVVIPENTARIRKATKVYDV